MGKRFVRALLKPKTLEAIYDYSSIDPNCFERYTFIFEPVELNNPRPGYSAHWILGTSDTGKGVSMWNELENKFIGPHLGKIVTWEEINDELKNHVLARLETFN